MAGMPFAQQEAEVQDARKRLSIVSYSAITFGGVVCCALLLDPFGRSTASALLGLAVPGSSMRLPPPWCVVPKVNDSGCRTGRTGTGPRSAPKILCVPRSPLRL